MTPAGQMQVGFRDVASFSVGVLVPMLLDATALVTAASVYVGAGAGPGLTVGMTAGLLLALALEMLRRYVLLTRPNRGALGVAVLRASIWLLLAVTLITVVFVAIGVAKPCFGQSCDPVSKFMMSGMLACGVLSLLMTAFGYRLLRRAEWLQTRLSSNT